MSEVLSRIAKKRNHISFRSVLSKACLVMCILGFTGFVNGFLTAFEKAFWVSPKTELPLGDIGGIAADSNGNVYMIAHFYSRIQKYSSDGEFLRGWPSNHNNPRLRVNQHDQLEVADDRRTRSGDDFPDTLSTYDSNGDLISEEVVDGCYDEFGEESEKSCQDNNGNKYSIHNKYWWPHVIKTTNQGAETKAVKTPFHLWLILGPFPAWIFMAVGLVGLGKLNK